jgi:hypothetical protein
MDPILIIIMVLMAMIIGLLIFNSKININMYSMAWIIVTIAFISILLLTLVYNAHTECYDLINHNNVTLNVIQDTCYKYNNF